MNFDCQNCRSIMGQLEWSDVDHGKMVKVCNAKTDYSRIWDSSFVEVKFKMMV